LLTSPEGGESPAALTAKTRYVYELFGVRPVSVRFERPDPQTARFSAVLNGPAGQPVWARAWRSTEAGTLSEAASPQMTAGDAVVLHVPWPLGEEPRFAYIRIESAPLKTEHVVGARLP
jgi:hypothetical protein